MIELNFASAKLRQRQQWENVDPFKIRKGSTMSHATKRSMHLLPKERSPTSKGAFICLFERPSEGFN